MEILSRVPSKSVARFRCVSKLWTSMLSSPYFKKLFLIRSSAKPRLLFAILDEDGVWSFFWLPQLENPHGQSTLVVASEFHVKLYHQDNIRYASCGYASGLFYIHGCQYKNYQARTLICNPITGRYAITPSLSAYSRTYSFLGFDPSDKKYKVFSMAYPWGHGGHNTLTFGDGDMKWRNVKCPLRYDSVTEGICINGVLYYVGDTSKYINDDHVITSEWVIVCFDLRPEKFTFIDVESYVELMNYKDKLALVYWRKTNAIEELHLWVLDDVEKQDWSKYAYTWTDFDQIFYVAGVTISGEIVFTKHIYIPKQPFYVVYFNPIRNTLQRVEVKGFGDAAKSRCTIRTFVNHVEDLDVNDLKLLKSVHHPPLVEPEYVAE